MLNIFIIVIVLFILIFTVFYILDRLAFILIFTVFYILDRLAKTPNFQIVGEFFNHVDTEELVVALTYDDGPNPPYTNQLIGLLEHFQIKATFFVTGNKVLENSETIKQLVLAGHELGNHSYSHQKMIWKTPSFIQSEINKTDQLLHKIGVKNKITFRAPYGLKLFVLPYILSKLGKQNILWNVDSKDYQESNPEVIANNVLENVSPGSIILLHDGSAEGKSDRSVTITATEILIKKLQAKGYKFKTVSELIEKNHQLDSNTLNWRQSSTRFKYPKLETLQEDSASKSGEITCQ